MGSAFGVISEETPAYSVLGTFSTEVRVSGGQKSTRVNYEVRDYEPGVMAATVSRSSSDGDGDSGRDDNSFMTLASYIGVMGTPRNDRSERIAMTAPVVSAATSAGSDTDSSRKAMLMGFVLPKKYNGGTETGTTGPRPPDPANRAVEIVQRPRKTFAVLTFSGGWGSMPYEAETQQLLEALRVEKNAKYTAAEPLNVEIYRYNPPWTLPFLRKNEVAIEVVQRTVERS